MLTDICDEIEEPVVDAVDANWCVSVSAKFFQSFQLVLDGNLNSTLQDVMTLILQLEHIAIDHGYKSNSGPSGWMASPINVSSNLTPEH